MRESQYLRYKTLEHYKNFIDGVQPVMLEKDIL